VVDKLIKKNEDRPNMSLYLWSVICDLWVDCVCDAYKLLKK
jgi:hypothetical protein